MDEIIFPSGGWVKYTWGVNKLSLSTWLPDTYSNPAACGYEYGQPAVVERQVSYDGTSIAQEQTFGYGTTWGSPVGNWSSKTTTATTYDELKESNFSTVYQYSPKLVATQPNASWFIEAEQVPVESQITYDDWSGATLRTVNKAWQDPYLMTCQSATQNGQIARTDTAYTGYGAVGAYTNLKTVQLPTDKKEWNWGQAPACGSPASGTPRRETQIAYQGFGATPIYPTASILDRPSTVTTNGNGTEAAQTQYAYDGTAVTGAGVTVGRDSTYNGNTTVPRGNATSKTEWLNGGTSPVTTYAYDDTGQMTSMKDPNGNTTQYAYSDNNTYLTQITYPNTGVAHVVKFSYNSADGQLASSTGQNGNVTTYSYSDSLDRLTQINYPDGGQTTYSYNDSPPTPSVTVTKKITSSENTVSTSIMDGVGHVTRTELTSDPQGADYTDSTYDGEGLAWKQSNPYRSTSDPSYGLTTTAYDAIGRTTSVTYPDENAASTVYSGNCSTVTDPQSKARKSCSDGLGRMTQVFEDPSGLNYETDYTYDALDNLIKVTEGSQTRSFVYDSLSRQLSATNPESGAVSYAYDANGNVQTKKDARSITTTYAYDALNRLTSKSYSDGTTPSAHFYYDEGTVYGPQSVWIAGLANTNGRLSHTYVGYSDGTSAYTLYGYDAVGREQIYWQCTPYNCGTPTIWGQSYTYDLAGDVISWAHPAGFTITNSINGAQRITQITSSLNDATHPGTLATITYSPWGAEQTLENGCAGSGCTNTVETYAYNKRLQPVMIELGTPSNASADYCLAYNYYSSLGSPSSCATPSQGTGDNGNVMGYFYQDNVNSGLSHTAAYNYDSLNRLTNAVATGNSTYNLTFSYDRYGNMTCTINGQTQGLCPQYSFNSATNQINTSGFSYDAAGNLTADGTHTYQYDGEGRVASADHGSTNTFAYNALGQWLYWRSGNSPNYVYDPRGRDAGYFDPGSGSWMAEIVPFGGRNLAAYSNSTAGFGHVNLLGSDTMVTSYNGSVSSDFLSYPWGQALTFQEGLFAGFSDLNTLIDAYAGRARQYGFNQGRWLTPDPANAGTDPSNPQTWDAYSYAGNNPTTNTDPSGEDYEVCVNSDNGDPQCTHIQNEALVQAVLANPGTGITVKGSESSGTIYGTDANGNQVEVGTYTQVAGPGSEAMASGGVSDASAPLVGFVAAGIGLIRSIGAEVFGSFFESQAPEAPVAAESGTGEVTGGFDQWNKIHHVFDNPGHGLGPLVEQYGSKEAAYNELQRAASEQLLPKGITGVFNEQVVSVGGTDITVSGRVMNGVVNIGTAFRPGFRP